MAPLGQHIKKLEPSNPFSEAIAAKLFGCHKELQKSPVPEKNRNSRQYERFPHVNSQISALRIAPVKQKRNSYVYEAYFIPCKEASEGNTVEDACFVSVAEAAPDTQTSL